MPDGGIMRLYTIIKDDRGYIAASEDGRRGFLLKNFMSMNNLIMKKWNGHIPGLSEEIDLNEVKIVAPIPHPRQDVICLGINYADHAAEASKFSNEAFSGDRPYPIFFSKRVNAAPGTGDTIPSYKGLVDSLDYECELGVIIGRDAKNVKADDAGEYVFGYTIINDISARNIQTRHKQWYFGKSFDGFTPMGPCIVTKDEFGFPPKLPIKCRVNGILRQDSDTGNLITGIPGIIECLSGGMTLQAGTIIATGTPSGAGMGMTPPAFLNTGDVVECEIGGIGKLTNTIG